MSASLKAVLPTPTARHLDLEVIDSLEAMRAVSAEWGALLETYGGRNLFLTPAWNRAWWRAFGADKRLRLLMLREGARLVGVLPCMLYSLRLRGLPVRVLGSFNNQHVSRADLVAVAGYESAVAQRIADYFADSSRDWDMALLQQLPAEADWLPSFMSAARACGLTLSDLRPGIGKCYLPLPGSWDAYIATRSKHFRRRVGETERRVERAGNVSYQHSINPGPDAPDFAVFAAVEQRSWKEEGEAHLGEQGWAFQREFATAYDEGIVCDNCIVELGGKPVAIVHTVGYNRVSYWLQMLYDRETRDSYVGRAAFTRHFRNILDQGRYDGLDLNGDSKFCKSWSETQQSFVSLQMFNRQPYSRLLHLLRSISKRGSSTAAHAEA